MASSHASFSNDLPSNKTRNQDRLEEHHYERVWESVASTSSGGLDSAQYASGESRSSLKPIFERVKSDLPAKLKRSPPAIDIGCGTGRNSVLLAETGFQVDAIDISESALDLARTLKSSPNISYKKCSVFDIDLVKLNYLVALDDGVFHHLRPDCIDDYFSKVRGILHDCGLFILVFLADSEANRSIQKYDDDINAPHFTKLYRPARVEYLARPYLKLLSLRTDKDSTGREFFISIFKA